jgi:hypothetical protein
MTQLIIDVDTRVTGPPDVWTARVPGKWLDEGPQVVRNDEGRDVWVLDGTPFSSPGLTAVAGCEQPMTAAPEQELATPVVAPPADAVAATAAIPDAATAVRPLLGRLAVSDGPRLTLYDVRADGLTAVSTTTVPEDPRTLVWPSPAGPVFLTDGEEVGTVLGYPCSQRGRTAGVQLRPGEFRKGPSSRFF